MESCCTNFDLLDAEEYRDLEELFKIIGNDTFDR